MSEPSAEDPLVDEATAPVEQDDASLSPPPHIKAHLCYPTNQTRRKESAASSRRNSISSIQSRSSHGHHATLDSPQSKYVAQHLRRASILEDRKARLADRAAHAEKVRLRAALAKAATRDLSVSAERAQAAAQARERNLAEIAAACAEEVKRAKAVAESTREKREQEVRKMRTQMEERLAEAERRREELVRSRNAATAKNRSRGQSLAGRKPALVEVLPQVREVKEREGSPIPQDVAVSKIQWWWRATRRRRALAEFAALRLTIEDVRDTSFETVTKLLAQENVLMATARVLRICGLREGDTGSVDEMAAVRTFLSAFLILGHPAQVLSSKEGKGAQEQVGSALAKPIPRDDLANPQLQELVGKARDLLISFENVLSRLSSQNNFTPPPRLLESLSEVYATFYNAFIAWKARDSNSLIEVMVLQFVELDAIWQSVKDNTDGSVDEVYRQSIQTNQLMLMVRIKKLAGPQQGKKLVFDAVRKARKAREKKPTGDIKPRVADNSITTETAMGQLRADDAHEPLQATQTQTPPSTPLRKGQTASAPVIVHSGKLRGLLPDNRVVVHELAINKEFRMAADEYREQQEHLLAPLFREMRATMQADNQDGHFLLLLEIAKHIREKLQRLVRPGNSMHTFIAELLDTDVAHQQFVAGSFSYEKFFQAMGTLLPKLCAPIRDQEVKELVETKLLSGKNDYVDRLEALMGFIYVMLSDYANYLLQVAAPQIIESAAAYEAKMFAAGDDEAQDLPAAEAAWQIARQKVFAEVARRDPEAVNHPRSRPTPDRIYAQMLVDLFTRNELTEAEMPEMLKLDYRRALRAGQVTRRIVIAATVLLQCKNALKRDVRAPWKTEAARIMAVLEAADQSSASSPSSSVESSSGGSSSFGPPLVGSSSAVKPLPATPLLAMSSTVDGIMAALEAGRSMPAATKSHLRGVVTRTLAAADTPAGSASSSEAPRDPVLNLLLNRLRGHLLTRLAAASASEKVRATSTAGEKLASLGLAEFVERVRDMVEEMAKVGTVDRDAHGPWWESVAERVERAEAAATSS